MLPVFRPDSPLPFADKLLERSYTCYLHVPPAEAFHQNPRVWLQPSRSPQPSPPWLPVCSTARDLQICLPVSCSPVQSFTSFVTALCPASSPSLSPPAPCCTCPPQTIHLLAQLHLPAGLRGLPCLSLCLRSLAQAPDACIHVSQITAHSCKPAAPPCPTFYRWYHHPAKSSPVPPFPTLAYSL